MKEIIVSIFSGIVGVFLTIGYEHYFSQPQQQPYTKEQINAIESTYFQLKESYITLENNFSALQDQYNQLQTLYDNKSVTYDQLQKDNNNLQNAIIQSQNEINNLQNEIEKLTELINNSEATTEETSNNKSDILDNKSTTKKVSIFNMDTFKGIMYWKEPTSIKALTDTYDNEYITARLGQHEYTKESKNVPIYLLDNKYSFCEGQIAWPKSNKNSQDSAWIEFYSGDELIYVTDSITAEDRAISFEFSVKGIEKLTIVESSTRRQSPYVNLIYSYFNLVE